MRIGWTWQICRSNEFMNRALRPTDSTFWYTWVWLRGISKKKLRDVTWLKDIAPSTELRKWFDHRPDRWEQFRTRYAAELDRNSDTVAKLRAICVRGHCYAALLGARRGTQSGAGTRRNRGRIGSPRATPKAGLSLTLNWQHEAADP